MKNKLFFDVDSAEIIEDGSNSQFATAKIEAFHTGKSLHDTTCDDETLIRTAPTLYEKPIIYEWDKAFRDFKSHGDHPIISGFVMADSAEFIRKPDGRLALSVLAKIWKRYASQFINAFTDTNTDKRSVSVEMEISSYEDDDGLTKLTDFAYSAICVLGEMVTPASPDSNLQMLSFAQEENEKYKKAFNEEFSSRYCELDFTIPASVKRMATKGLESHGKSGGGNSTALAMGRHLVKSSATTPDRLKQIEKFFAKKADPASVAYMLWGGNACKNWCHAMLKQMSDIDEKQTSFFSKEDFADKTKESETEMKEDITQMAKKKIEMAEDVAEEPKEEMASPVEEPKDKMAEEVAPAEEPKEEMAEAVPAEEPKEEMAEPAEEKPADEEKPAEEEKPEEFSMDALMAKMQEMEDKNKVLMSENEELKNKFAEIESQKKEFAVDSFLVELNSKVVIPADAYAELKAKSKEFSNENLNDWKNLCKATVFEFAKRAGADEGVTVFALPFMTNVVTQTTNVWDNLK